MLCMHCSTAQKAAQNCQNCHVRLARYYCDKVRSWTGEALTGSVIYGMTRLQSRSTIAQTAGSVVLVKVLGKTFSIARYEDSNLPLT
jgi:hypothetical protein